MPAQYGKKWATQGQAEDVTLPSGEVVSARRPGVQGLIKAGIINELDSLTGLVDANHNQRVNPSKKAKGKGAKPVSENLSNAEIKELLGDEGKLENVLRVAAKVAVYVVVRPTLRPHWAEEKDDDGKTVYRELTAIERAAIKVELMETAKFPEDPILFTDEVDMEDTMFLMNYAVGGTRDLAQFRSQLDESVASVESLKDLSL